jgi:DNA-binding response OmpR family regulator
MVMASNRYNHPVQRCAAICLNPFNENGLRESAPMAEHLPLASAWQEVDVTSQRVLVVDDETSIRETFEYQLGRWGYDVRSAASGEEALSMLAEFKPALVITDVCMPGMDGLAVLKQLKASPNTRDVPVIVVSAVDDMASVVRCIECGAEDYLPKPCDSVLLYARIGASLEKKRLRDLEVEYLREVERVIRAARAVEAGHYQAGALAVVAARADELGRLARVFDAMAAGIREREEQLTDQLRELRREIALARDATQSPASDAMPALEDGRVFAGRYQILSTEGSGGMGLVYRAHDQELGEDVAIKVLHPDLLTGDPTAIQRLKEETRLARRISHRNVVRTHDFGEWQGACYITMEFVSGLTVRRLLETRGRLSVAAALAVARQLADALEVAHLEGVVHRDIKPQNLLLDVEGVLKVMDFGVARLAEHTTVLTQAGMVIGTPAYMSPEQLLAEEVDGRSDLYSTGVVLYECLTGCLPFQAKSSFELAAKLLRDEPASPALLNPGIPPALAELVLRLLSKRPEARPASAADLAGLLAQLG